ncbi:DMT family transporter [Paenibacillus radicis (ex Xue et al. 2023)]|uniref:DMT family transporter n=1 Tax=Paenibacillus radicis (ex Xue et al. 2023) TaxID=2972489 RepID=A0ABT1YMC5_9BACL|nr:DMT family transporter [Paenibacillus radicis (ex Xue et al. 2023)]MCR8634327.1 DMT family transporter [Paenibacillus radicis (ex Xue et al. 2023)]
MMVLINWNSNIDGGAPTEFTVDTNAKLFSIGLFSVIVYLQPVLVAIFAWMWLGERMSILKVVGLLLGFLGVTVVSVQGFYGYISLLGIALALG